MKARMDDDLIGRDEPRWEEPKNTKPIDKEVTKRVPVFPVYPQSLSDIADPPQQETWRRRPRPWYVIIATLIERDYDRDINHPFYQKMVEEGISDSDWPVPQIKP